MSNIVEWIFKRSCFNWLCLDSNVLRGHGLIVSCQLALKARCRIWIVLHLSNTTNTADAACKHADTLRRLKNILFPCSLRNSSFQRPWMTLSVHTAHWMMRDWPKRWDTVPWSTATLTKKTPGGNQLSKVQARSVWLQSLPGLWWHAMAYCDWKGGSLQHCCILWWTPACLATLGDIHGMSLFSWHASLGEPVNRIGTRKPSSGSVHAQLGWCARCLESECLQETTTSMHFYAMPHYLPGHMDIAGLRWTEHDQESKSSESTKYFRCSAILDRDNHMIERVSSIYTYTV